MLSLIHTRPIKTTLIFPNDQKLWAFFTRAEVSEFRIESSKNAITGKLYQEDIELAKQRFDADELKEKMASFSFKKYLFSNVSSFVQICARPLLKFELNVR